MSLEQEDAAPQQPKLPKSTVPRDAIPRHATGLRQFEDFEKKIIRLEAKLQELSNKARELGSSVGILSASTRLSERLANVVFLFNENTADLFPGSIQRNRKNISRHRLSFDSKHKLVDIVETDNPEPSAVLSELQGFAQDIMTLLECFSHFSEFKSAVPDPPAWIQLRRRAEYLEAFQQEYHNHAVQVFLHESMVHITPQVEAMSEQIIPSFLSDGIPTVKTSQDHSVSILDNLSTVSTFFSGVTASMIQITWDSSSAGLDEATNAFWLISLVFSTSAAVYSLLGLTWTQAIFRSPNHHVPWWVRIWMRRSPLVLLVLSMASFFVGLVLFTFSTKKTGVISTIAVVLSSVCCVGLIVLSMWFALEQWTYVYYQGHKWFAEVLDEARRAIAHKILDLCHLLPTFRPYEVWQHVSNRLASMFRRDGVYDEEKPRPEARGSLKIGGKPIPDDLLTPFWPDGTDPTQEDAHIRAQHRWHEACHRICAALRSGKLAGHPVDSSRVRQLLERDILNANDAALTRIKEYIHPRLERMAVSWEPLKEDPPQSLVRFMRFSPDEKAALLLVSRFDKVFVLNTNESDATKNTSKNLLSDKSNAMRQSYWSPDGRNVLLLGTKSIATMSAQDLLNPPELRPDSWKIHSPSGIQAIAWAGNNATVSIEESEVVITKIDSQDVHRHTVFEDFQVGDIAITKDSRWMLCTGSRRLEPPTKSKAWNPTIRSPFRARKPQGSATKETPKQTSAAIPLMHQLELCCLKTNKIVLKAPMVHKVYNVALSSHSVNGYVALLSFEDQSAPQLWHIITWGGRPIKFAISQTYKTETTTSFARLPSIFGGPEDELIMRASLDNGVHVWDRTTATYLRRIVLPSRMGQLTALAWDYSTSEWSFATGTHDGKVQIWTECEPSDNCWVCESLPEVPRQ